MISKAPVHREYCFPGLNVTQQPSAVDSALPPIYSRRVLIFSNLQPPSRDQGVSDAISVLREAIRLTVEEFPILSNSVSFASGAWRFLPGQARLHVKELPMSFEELKNSKFSSKLLQPEILSSVPGMIDFENDWDCCRFQANFIDGGLLLSVSIIHLAMDGVSITNVVQALARNSYAPTQEILSKSENAFDRSRLSTSSSVPDIAKMPAYMILPGAFDFASRTAGSITSTMYQFTDDALAQLKSDCSSTLSNGQWVTTQDSLSALVFRQKIKARFAAGILKSTDQVQYSFPVEYRNIIDPPLPPDFVGNAIVFTATPFFKVSDLIVPQGLSLAAAGIRKAIQDVDAPFIDNFIAVVKSLPDPRALNFYGAVHSGTTGINSTTYKSFVMPNEWHSSIGKYELMRLLDGGFGDGMFVVMPVRETGWEVIVTLSDPAMAVFEDEEWMRYAVKVDVV